MISLDFENRICRTLPDCLGMGRLLTYKSSLIMTNPLANFVVASGGKRTKNVLITVGDRPARGRKLSSRATVSSNEPSTVKGINALGKEKDLQDARARTRGLKTTESIPKPAPSDPEATKRVTRSQRYLIS